MGCIQGSYIFHCKAMCLDKIDENNLEISQVSERQKKKEYNSKFSSFNEKKKQQENSSLDEQASFLQNGQDSEQKIKYKAQTKKFKENNNDELDIKSPEDIKLLFKEGIPQINATKNQNNQQQVDESLLIKKIYTQNKELQDNKSELRIKYDSKDSIDENNHLKVKLNENLISLQSQFNNSENNRSNSSMILDPKNTQQISADIFVHLKKNTISEYYSINELIGEGSYGRVNVVTNKKTGLIRALKTIRKQNLSSNDRSRIANEMKILRKLNHPNIIKLYDLFQDQKNYYLITEYCNGGEVFDRIQKIKNLTEKQASVIMEQILSAVVYIHYQGIAHRDLKPENMVFETKRFDSILKLIDFGTAVYIKQNEFLKDKIGTVQNLSSLIILHQKF